MPVLPGAFHAICVLSIAAALGGCGPAATKIETGSLAAETGRMPVRDLPVAPVDLAAAPPHAGRLDLSAAIRRVLAFNPAIKAAFHEIGAKEGEAVQASYRKNPELTGEVENFAGSKDKSGSDAAEETLSIAQTIELGDKRMKRLQTAQLDASLAGWDFETTRVKMATAAAQAFVEVIAAQERVKVLGEFVAIADKTRGSVAARVKGGKASPIEQDRAVVAFAKAKAMQAGERSRLDAAKLKLASLWGSETVDFDVAVGRLGNGYEAPSVADLKSLLENNPQLARWTDEVGRRVAQLDLEHAKAVPDVTVGAGVRHFNENDSTAMVATVSMPIPVFDRNRGNIAAAERRIAKAEHDRDAARTELFGALAEAVGQLKVAAVQLKALERDVLPAAQSAFDRTQIGYDEGKFDILNVLDAQRTVFETRAEVLSARADYEKARVAIEALVGRELDLARNSR